MNAWFVRTHVKRTAAVTLAAATLTLGLVGCSAGLVSQTAAQEPAVNGVSARAGSIQLRNVHLRGDQTLDAIQPGTEVELLLVAANLSADVNDTLLDITSDIGDVELVGDDEVKAGRALIVGVPDGVPEGVEAVEGSTTATATVMLTKPISNGVTYDFTFRFENAGETTIGVPIDAGLQPRREEVTEDHGSSGEH